MIWIKTNDRSFSAISINVSEKEGELPSLWATRIDKVSYKVIEGDKEIVHEYREAIDYAVSKGEKVFDLTK